MTSKAINPPALDPIVVESDMCKVKYAMIIIKDNSVCLISIQHRQCVASSPGSFPLYEKEPEYEARQCACAAAVLYIQTIKTLHSLNCYRCSSAKLKTIWLF